MSKGPNEYDAPEPSDPYEAMPDPDDDASGEEIADTLDAIDQGDPAEDEANLYDTSFVPPHPPPAHSDFGTTLTEEREGESLELRLSEEEPDVFDEVEDEDDAEVATEEEAEDPL